MLVLAAACALLGLMPVVTVRPASATATLILNALGSVVPEGTIQTLSVAAVTLGGVAIALLGLGALTWYLRRRSTRALGAGLSATWGCAYAGPTARMQYTAGSFAAPLLHAVGGVARPEMVREPGSLETRPGDRVLDRMVRPLWHRARGVAAAFRPLQQGPVTRYLQYIVLTVLLLLGALFLSIVRRS
jgi:hypothetical protein